MKFLRLFIFILLFAGSALADDKVTIQVRALYIGDTPVSRLYATLTPLGPLPRVYYTNQFSRQEVSRLFDTNGFAYFSNVLWGYYRLTIPGDSFNLEVGTNLSGVVNASILITNSATLPPNPATSYYTKSQTDALIAGIDIGDGGGGIINSTVTNLATSSNNIVVQKVTAPFLSIPTNSLTAAKQTAVAGDTIFVRAGIYPECDLLKNGVNWFFYPGAVVAHTNSDSVSFRAIFDDRFTGAVTSTIAGYGIFKKDAWTNQQGFGTIVTTNALTRLTASGQRLEFSYFNSSQAAAALAHYDGTNYFDFDEVRSPYRLQVRILGLDEFDEPIPVTENSSGVRFDTGEAHIRVRLLAAQSLYALSPNLPQPKAEAGRGGNLWYSGDLIESYSYGAVYYSTVYNWKAWIEFKEHRGGIALLGGGRWYINGQKLSRTDGLDYAFDARNTEGSVAKSLEVWLNVQKISSAKDFLNVGTNAVLYADVLQFESVNRDNGAAQSGNLVNIGDGGELWLKGSSAVISNGIGINLGRSSSANTPGGTAHVSGLTIDTSAGTQPPVFKGGGTMSLNNVVLIGPATTNSIGATNAQTVELGGFQRNRPISANVTFTGTNEFNRTVGTYLGDAAGLTNANATTFFNSGTLPAARLPAFSGAVTTSAGSTVTSFGPSPTFTGTTTADNLVVDGELSLPNAILETPTFGYAGYSFGGGEDRMVLTIDGQYWQNLNASQLASGTVPNARLDADLQTYAGITPTAPGQAGLTANGTILTNGHSVTVTLNSELSINRSAGQTAISDASGRWFVTSGAGGYFRHDRSAGTSFNFGGQEGLYYRTTGALDITNRSASSSPVTVTTGSLLLSGNLTVSTLSIASTGISFNDWNAGFGWVGGGRYSMDPSTEALLLQFDAVQRLDFGGVTAAFPAITRRNGELVLTDAVGAGWTNNLIVPGFLTSSNGHRLDMTITAGGTTGDRTINKSAGTVNFAATTATLTVTCDKVTANSLVVATVRTADSTAQIKNVVPGSGSFVINLVANTTAETSVGFVVYNPPP